MIVISVKSDHGYLNKDLIATASLFQSEDHRNAKVGQNN